MWWALAVTLVVGRQLLPPDHPFNRDVSGECPVAESDTIISAIANWGTGSATLCRIDRSLVIGNAGPSTNFVSFTKKSGYYEGECDNLTEFPLPVDSTVEGSTALNDYRCSGSDCHILTVDVANRTIWEGYSCNQPGGPGTGIECLCGVVWDMCGEYPLSQRGKDCTSADAAGFSVAALTVTSEEVAKDEIDHAMRFILNNDQIRANVYGYPCTHSTSTTSGSSSFPWYGVRLRLKASYPDAGPLGTFPIGAQRLVRALKKYGMFLADGGNIPLTLASDVNSVFKWADYMGAGNPDTVMDPLRVSDFEVMPTDQSSPLVTYTGNCVLNTISSGTCSNAITNSTTTNSSSPTVPCMNAVTTTSSADSSTSDSSASPLSLFGF